MPEELKESNKSLLHQLEEGAFDFVDFGSNHGGGFQIGYQQGGRRGLGFDLQPHLVQYLKEQGLDAVCADIRTLDAKHPVVEFSVCSHVLEHLPSLSDIKTVINTIKGLSRDYILISGPCFDEEAYLYSQDLKILHSAMTDHLTHMKIVDLVQVLHEIDLRDYIVGLTLRLKDSKDVWIFKSDEPEEDLWTWSADRNLPKPNVIFDRPIFRDFVCIVQLSEGIDPVEVLSRFMWGHEKIAIRSAWRF